MTEQTVSATITLEDETKVTHEVQYDFGDNLKEIIAKFGEDVVYQRFKAAVVVDLQAVVRRLTGSKEPKIGDALQAAVNEWKPGVAKVRKSKTEKALDLLNDMDPDEFAAFLKEVKAPTKDKAEEFDLREISGG